MRAEVRVWALALAGALGGHLLLAGGLLLLRPTPFPPSLSETAPLEVEIREDVPATPPTLAQPASDRLAVAPSAPPVGKEVPTVGTSMEPERLVVTRRRRKRPVRPVPPAASPPVAAPAEPAPATEGVVVPGPGPGPADPSADSSGRPSAFGAAARRALAARLAAERPPEDGVLRPDPTLRPAPKGPKYPLVPTPKGGLVYKDSLYTANVAPDGTVAFENKPVVCYEGKCAPNDPEILAYEQARFLEATFEQRMQLGAKARVQTLKQGLAELPQRLERVWANQQSSVLERHRLLFDLWDECHEPRDASQADLSGGRYARAAIMAFIRRHLPKGSTLAYGDEELEELNGKRTSREKFEPYPR